jgi:diadenylate cyclase
VRLRTLLGTNKPVEEMDTIITQTVMACETMSHERVGALIVFAREARLEEYFKTGTRINGQVSEQLIRNIFFPKASLHDGAMIVREGRIAAAGCVLPLSESHRLSADLGTRHRAGVGISEVSDAVVVIVSEETGTISVAVGGMLKRHLAAKTLEKLLRNELCPAEEDEELSLVLRLREVFVAGTLVRDVGGTGTIQAVKVVPGVRIVCHDGLLLKPQEIAAYKAKACALYDKGIEPLCF